MKLIILFFNLLLISNSLAQNYGGWTIADSLNEPRQNHSSVLLNDSSILVSGGPGDGIRLSSCEIFNPYLNQWRQTDSMNFGRTAHLSILLNNNRVLVVGSNKTRSCEIFDPQAETWIFTDSLNIRRMFNHTATLLNNGKVLVVGGYDVPIDTTYGVKLKDCELYNPATNSWSITDSLKYERWAHTATLLADGRVLVCGGDTLPSEIFDPITETWSNAAPMINKRNYQSAILLPDGNVLVSGGYSSSSWFNDCELYNPINDEWLPAGTMQFARDMHSSILLDNGLILFAGGYFASIVWELYDPSIMQSVYWDYYPVDKFLPTMHLLPDGRVISIGGTSWINTYFFPTNMCEIYDPNLNSIQNTNNSGPNRFDLYQNYPNPFNPSTRIKYCLPYKTFVKLKVFDVSGRLVSILVNKVQSAGFFSFNFNAQKLSSGIYLVSLQTDKFFKIIKMIKLK